MPEPPPQPQTGYPPAPVNLGQGAGGFVIPPIPPAFGGPMPPVVPPYPAGFFPQGGPQAPVIPEIDRSPVHSPVIPHAPPGWGMEMPEASQYVGPTGPVLPGTPFREYHPTGPSEYVHHIEEPDDERVIPTTPTSGSSRSPLPIPRRGSRFVPPTPGHDSRSSTTTQESYQPPLNPGGLPIPSGDVPHVIPVDHSMGGPRHTPPPHQTVINVPQTAYPPPGHVIEQGIPVQPSITLQQPGMPIHPGGVAIHPSMQGIQPAPIVIHPPMQGYPVPVSESVYVPSRATSRASARPPVVVIQSSLDHSPVQMPASMVGVPASIHLHDDHDRRSPTIPGLPSSSGPHIMGQTTGGSRPYSPEGRHRRGSPSHRDYSPRDEGHRLRRRRHPDDRRRSYSYSPDGGYRRRYYSPEYEADPRYRYRRPYSPGDPRYRRYGDDDHSPERRRRARYDDDGHSPDRRRRGRYDDDDYSPGRRRRGRYDEDEPEDRRRRRRDDRDHPERGDGEHSPDDPGRRRDGRRRGQDDRDHPERDDEEHSPEDPGRGAHRRRPSGRSASHPDAEERDAGDRPHAQPSDARSARGPGFGEGDIAGALPHPVPPPASPPPPTIIRLGGEPRTRKSVISYDALMLSLFRRSPLYT